MTCKRVVEMQDVQTIRTRNLRYVHEGRCPKDGSIIWKFVKENQMEDIRGARVPKILFIGKKTPRKIKNIQIKKDFLKSKGVINGTTLLRRK